MWVVGVVMMVALCFGGGFLMHKHAGGENAQVQTTKDAPRPVHGHGDATGLSGDESKGTHQPMMQFEQQDVRGNGASPEDGSDGKGIAK